MDHKAINEFSVQVVRARNQLHDVTINCENLKQEADRLKQEIQHLIQKQKKVEEARKIKMEAIKNRNQIIGQCNVYKVLNAEALEFKKTHEEILAALKERRKAQEKQKEQLEKENDKLNGALTIVLQERDALHAAARGLEGRLECESGEHSALDSQFRKRKGMAALYHRDISNYQSEYQKMKNVLSKTLSPDCAASRTKSPSGKQKVIIIH